MKVIRNYLYNAGFQVLSMILPLITGPYVSRTLGPHGVGINAYTNSIIQWFVLFGSIGIGLYGNREIAYRRGNKQDMSQAFWEIQALKFLFIGLAYVAFFVYILLVPKYRPLMWLQSLYILAAAVDISWLYMGLEDFKKTVVRNALVKVASVILIFSFVHDSSDLGLYILIMGSATVLGNLTLWPYLRRFIVKVKLSSLHPLRHLRPTVALFAPQIAIQIYVILNKTMLGALGHTNASGYYDRADMLVKFVLSIVTATGTVMLPHVANTFAKGDKERIKEMLYDSFDFVSFLAIAMTFGLAAISIKLGPFFFGVKFVEVGEAMLLESAVILLIGWSNVIGQQFLLPTGKVREYTTSVTLGAIANIITNFPLIYYWGLYGAIISTVISELIVTLYQVWHVRDTLELKKMFINVPKYLIAAVPMFIVVYWLNVHTHFYIVTLFGEVLLGIVIYFGILLLIRPSIFKKAKKLLKK